MRRITFQFKFTLILIVLLSIISIISVSIFSLFQQNSTVDTTLQAVTINNRFLISVIEDLMANGNMDLVASAIEKFSNQDLDTNVQIFRLDGTAAFSNFEDSSSANSDQSGEDSSPRTLQPALFEDSLEFNQVVNTAEPQIRRDENAIIFFFPIHNTLNCRDCPENNEDLWGVIKYQTSIYPMMGNIQNYNVQYLIFLIISFAVVILVLFTIFHLVINKPLNEFAESINQFTKGDLNKRVYEFKSNDVLGSISIKLNVLFDDIQNKITVESDRRAAEITEKENQKYLKNVSEGILFIDNNRKITPWVSHSIRSLFETDEIVGRSLANFLFPRDEPDDIRIRMEIQEFIDVAFENINISEELLTSLNPLQNKEIYISGKNGLKRIVISASFHQIFENDSVINLMVSFTDVTKLAETVEVLESQEQIKESEFSLIASIVKADKTQYKQFIKLAESLKEELQTSSIEIKKLDALLDLSVNLGFTHLGEVIHSIIREISSNSESSQLSAFIEEFGIALDFIKQWKHEFAYSTTNSTLSRRSNLHKLQSEIEALLLKLSKEYAKSTRFLLRSKIQNLPLLPYIKDAIINIIHNAIMHGIEYPNDRLEAGKNKTGHIELFCVEMETEYKIIIADDGNGIDFLDLEKRARIRRIITQKADQSKLIQLLFSPGLSKNKPIDTPSGLSNVQKIIQIVHGKISIYTKEQYGTHITIIVPKAA